MFYLTLPSVANLNLYSRRGQVDDLHEQHFRRQLGQEPCITKIRTFSSLRDFRLPLRSR